MNTANNLVIIGALLALGLMSTAGISYIEYRADIKEKQLHKELNSIETKITKLKSSYIVITDSQSSSLD
jgi:hypothetical protein